MSSFILSQCVAALAFAAGLAAYQGRTRGQILGRWALAAGLNAVHFALLGVWGAATLATITCARFLAARFVADRRVMLVFLVLAASGFLLTYSHPIGFLALGATLLGTWASFQPGAGTVRVAFAVCAALWFAHNLLAGSPVAAVMEVAFLASNALGWWRTRRAAVAAAD